MRVGGEEGKGEKGKTPHSLNNLQNYWTRLGKEVRFTEQHIMLELQFSYSGTNTSILNIYTRGKTSH